MLERIDFMGADKAVVVIFAGGTGSRMQGSTVPKQFLELGGKPIIAHTIDHFEAHPEIDAIVVACIEEKISLLEDIVKKCGYSKVVSIVPGGKTGQESIFNGLLEFDRLGIPDEKTVVLVHDGVRPLIEAKTISDCISSVRLKGCTATVAPAVETVIEERDGCVERVINRSCCKLARAPQGFVFQELFDAHKRAIGEGKTDFIDSISLMSHYGHEIHTVEGPADNIKITTRRDFFAFKGYMDYKEMEQLWKS